MTKAGRDKKLRARLIREVRQVVKAGPKRKRKVPAQIKKSQQVMSVGGLTCMERAILYPFERSSEGCRVDDAYGLPTRTDHIRQSWTLTNPAAGGTGTCKIALLPSATNGGWTDGNMLFTGPAFVQSLTSGVAYGAILESSFDSIGMATRPVAVGIRVRNLLNFSAISGKIYVAPIVFPAAYLTQRFITQNAGSVSSTDLQIIMANSTDPSTAFNMPGGEAYCIDELIGDELLLSCRPCGPNASKWRSCSADQTFGAAAAYSMQGGPFIPYATAGGVFSASTADACQVGDCGDWVGWYVYVTGAPTTASLNILDVDVVYHYETQPIGNTNVLVPTMAPEAKSTYSYDQQLKRILDFPYQRVASAVSNAVNAGGMLSRIAGQYMKPPSRRSSNLMLMN